MELKKYNANHTQVLKINQIVRTISETHKFDKDKLIAINTSDVENGVMGNGTLTFVDELKGQFKKTIVKDDILFSEIRPANRRFAKVTTKNTKDYVVSTKLMVLRKYNEDVDLEYFYYCLTNQPFLDILQRRAENRIGSFPQITFDLLSEYAFPIPPISEQKRISSVISTLDKKIALNRQINQNLEAMAKLLYDYWFVQFDFPNENGKPYKSSGGKMVWNKKIKREIPEGWKEVTLNAFIDKNKAGDWGYDIPKDGTIKVGCVRGADIIKLNDVPTRYITSKHSDRLLEDGDIVIEISGGSPVQATGRVALITNGVIGRNGGALVCSNFCQSFNMKKREFSEYFYYLWQNLYDNGNMFNFEGKTSGIKNFQTDVFLANHWFEVPKQLIETFHTIVAQYHLMIDQNIIENNNLTKQRDELLPLLMNGQVSVNSDLADD